MMIVSIFAASVVPWLMACKVPMDIYFAVHFLSQAICIFLLF